MRPTHYRADAPIVRTSVGSRTSFCPPKTSSVESAGTATSLSSVTFTLAASLLPVLFPVLLVILTVTSLSVASLLQMFRPRTIPVVEPATVYIVLKVPLSIATSAIVKTLKVLVIYFSPY